VLSTEEAGGVMSLTLLRALIGDDGALTGIAVSMDGDVRNDLDVAQDVADALEPTLTDQGIGLLLFKKVNVDISVLVANVFTSLFLVLGLFSIGVGILLIVLIFTMLAAERRPEMGMARAVGQRRRQLIQQFVSEGTSYALLAGGLGVALGIVATFIIAAIVNNLFGEFFPIRAEVSARSLVAAFSLGVVITFLSVVASSIKISRMNVVAAIRDIPDVSNPKRRIRDAGRLRPRPRRLLRLFPHDQLLRHRRPRRRRGDRDHRLRHRQLPRLRRHAPGAGRGGRRRRSDRRPGRRRPALPPGRGPPRSTTPPSSASPSSGSSGSTPPAWPASRTTSRPSRATS
jgi:hypothetical protein